MLIDTAEKRGIEYDKTKTRVVKSISGEEEVVAVDEEPVRKPEILKIYEEIIEEINDKLAAHERIRKFRILSEAFTIDRGEITPTLKSEDS